MGVNADDTGNPRRVKVTEDFTVPPECVPACGNSIVEAGEQCDDGNTQGGDCCSSTCQFEPVGSSCDDSNACTVTDTCNGSGTCTAGPPLVCNDGNVCTDDNCNPASGCVFPNNTAPCDDGAFCNGADVCSGGSCSSHAGDPCTGSDGDANCSESCDEGADNCSAVDPDGSVCSDGDACTTPDTCSGGSCQVGPPLDCDDGDVCTAESCDEILGCAHDPIPGCEAAVPASSGRGRLLLVMLMLAAAVAVLGQRRRVST